MAPLSQIPDDIQRYKHLSPILRAQIIGAHRVSAKQAQICREFGVPKQTVSRTIQQDSIRDTVESLPKSGRPRKLSDRETRLIKRYVNNHPNWTYNKLLSELPFTTSRSTVYRILKEYGIIKWLAKKRPMLNETAAFRRLQWCQNYQHLTVGDWIHWIFSDECSVERGTGKRPQWVWRHTGQAYDKDKVQPTNKSKDVSVMVWAAISKDQLSDLIVMRRDMSSRNQGYTANSYIDALQLGLLSIWEPSKIFQQDNARIHTANKTKAFFREINLNWLVDWPPHSPDLNPIEHVWNLLKQKLYQLFPEAETWSGSHEAIQERIEDVLIASWAQIDRRIVYNLIESMPRRVQAVIDAEGWYTKY